MENKNIICQECKKEFEDFNYNKFGTPLSKRVWCDDCATKKFEEVKLRN